MAKYNIQNQAAGLIQNADTIINNAQPVVDHLAVGESALKVRDYESAIANFRHAVDLNPRSSLARYFLVLAQLRGYHPSRFSAHAISEFIRNLVEISKNDLNCHHVKILALVINDGVLARTGRRLSNPSDSTLRSVTQIDSARGAELLFHLDVPESPTYQTLVVHMRRRQRA